MIRHLLLPSDGSALAERGLPYAQHLASVAGARLTLLQCEALPATGKIPDFNVEAFARRLRESQAVVALTAPGRIEIEAVGMRAGMGETVWG